MIQITEITSRDNERLKDARRVRDGRDDERIFVEGDRLVEEALGSGLHVRSFFATQGHVARGRDMITRTGVREIYQLSDAVFRTISDTVNSQGIAIVADRPAWSLTDITKRLSSGSVPHVVFLHEINNPSNLGAVVRTAEAAGVGGVIVSANSADAFGPKALRAAMGSAFRLPIVVGSGFEDGLEFARANRLLTVGADVNADRSHWELDWQVPRMLVVGSEAHGLDEDQRSRLDALIRVPMEREVESLNLAVACGIILFEGRRQRMLA